MQVLNFLFLNFLIIQFNEVENFELIENISLLFHFSDKYANNKSNNITVCNNNY